MPTLAIDPLISRLSVGHLKVAYHTRLHDVLGHVETVKRLERALDILTRDERYSLTCVAKEPLTFLLVGPNDTYTIIESQQSCTCPDTQQLCKHRLVVQLVLHTITLMKEEK